MSSMERSQRSDRLAGWRDTEPSDGRRDGVRLRSPILRPRDFVVAGEPVANSEEPKAPIADAAVSQSPSKRSDGEEPAVPRPIAEPVVAVAMPTVEQVVVPPVSAAALAAKLPLLDLRSAIASIWAKKLVVLALAGAGAVLGGAVIPLIPQKFTAETSLYFDPRPVGGSDSAQQAPTPPELITTLVLKAQDTIQGSRIEWDAGWNDIAHRVQVQLEMAVVTVIEPVIGLFAKDDFVDQARRLRILWRQPGQLHTGEFLLQAFGQ